MDEEKRKEVVDFLFSSIESYSKELNVKPQEVLQHLNNASTKIPDYTVYPSFVSPDQASNEKSRVLHDLFRTVNSLYFLRETEEKKDESDNTTANKKTSRSSENFLTKELDDLLEKKNKFGELKDLDDSEIREIQRALQRVTQKVMLSKRDGILETRSTEQEAQFFQTLIQQNVNDLNAKYPQLDSPWSKQVAVNESAIKLPPVIKRSASQSQVLTQREASNDKKRQTKESESIKDALQNYLKAIPPKKTVRLTKQEPPNRESTPNSTAASSNTSRMLKRSPTPDNSLMYRIKKQRDSLGTSISESLTSRGLKRNDSLSDGMVKSDTRTRTIQSKDMSLLRRRNTSIKDNKDTRLDSSRQLQEEAAKRELGRSYNPPRPKSPSDPENEGLTKKQIELLDKFKEFTKRLAVQAKKEEKPKKGSKPPTRGPSGPGGL